MNKINMQYREHSIKVGERCLNKNPNIIEDTIFLLDNIPTGFYIKSVNGKVRELLEIANKEFNSDNVPKTLLERSDVFTAVYSKGLSRKQAKATQTVQMSTILGSVAPKAHMRRPYPSTSAVHREDSARNFIKSMLMLSRESGQLIKKYLPEVYKKQKQVIKESVKKQWRFGDMFTSSISNYNISAPYHRDTGNLKDTVNAIFFKRYESIGGCLHLPDYDMTIACGDNSMLCYPAWKNVHGVTPIRPNIQGGYRNSLIFYPLKGFGNGKT